MAKYILEITKIAEKQIKKIPNPYQKKIIEAIRMLASTPFPTGCKKLSGQEDTFRVRVGNYRVIYYIKNNSLVVIVLKVGHRKDVYELISK